jgi:hypothetical protein
VGGGLQIAVNDPLLVRGFERLGDLLRDRQRLVNRNRPACEPLCEVLALDELQDAERSFRPVLPFQPVDLRDMGMIERGELLRLAPEPREPFGIGRDLGQQNLQGDVASQCGIAGAIDGAHPAFAEPGGDFIGAEAGARRAPSALVAMIEVESDAELSGAQRCPSTTTACARPRRRNAPQT